jgi:hypothetical protein
MYQIRAKYSYYSSTCNAPKNGVLRHNNGQVVEFETRNDAIDYLCHQRTCERDSDGSYSQAKPMYELAHGEYARPSYKIITSKP